MRTGLSLNLLAALCITVAGCNSSGPEAAQRQAGRVEISASASVRINGQPAARAAAGEPAGRALLATDCTAGKGLRQSPDVRINGAPATTVEPGANPSSCRVPANAATSPNVKVGG